MLIEQLWHVLEVQRLQELTGTAYLGQLDRLEHVIVRAIGVGRKQRHLKPFLV
jgi:hypothetical protein